MSEFKKAFRGYRVSDVNARLSELEQHLQTATKRCTLLEQQLNNSQQSMQNIQQQLSSRNTELEKLTWEYDQINRQRKEEKSEIEKIGRVYLKAFESGREIALAPNIHIRSFLEKIEQATQSARQEIDTVRQNFLKTEQELGSVVADIKVQADILVQKLKELSLGIAQVEKSYSKFDQVKASIDVDIAKIRARYESQVSDYTGGTVDSNSFVEPVSVMQKADQKNSVETVDIFESDAKTSDQILQQDEKDVTSSSVDTSRMQSAEQNLDAPFIQEYQNASSEDTYADFLEENPRKNGTENKEELSGLFPENTRGRSVLELLNKYKKQ